MLTIYEQELLLDLIEEEKADMRRRLHEGPEQYERHLTMILAIGNPDTPSWKVKIYSELLEEPSPYRKKLEDYFKQ